MLINTPGRSGADILLIFLTALGVWGLGILGWFQALDGLLYDQMVRHGPVGGAPSGRLLLIETPENADAAVWPRLLDSVQQQGARQVVFTALPPGAGREFYAKAADYGNVLFGRALRPAPEDPAGIPLEPFPHALGARQLEFAAVAVPPAEHGIYRRQYPAYTVQGQTYPALEIAAARWLQGDLRRFPKAPYRVNFYGAAERLPQVPLDSVLEGRLPPNLVQGKTLLIGQARRAAAPGLYTPVSTTTESTLPMLVFQGLALDSVLEDRMIRDFPGWATLLMLLLVAALGIVFYQMADIRLAAWLTLALVVGYELLAWLLPAHAEIWPPVLQMTLLQLLVLFLVLRHKRLSQERALQEMLLETSERLYERTAPSGFAAAENPWEPIIRLINQTLTLSRSIFLERIEGQQRVREIKGLNCSLSDIDERRRDYGRAPYSQAIAEGRPVRLVQRLFLKSNPAEEQYLAPLSFGGEVLGFWAFSVATEQVAAVPRFLPAVQAFGEQIAELLYYRRQWLLKELAGRSGPLQRYLRLQGGERPYETLRQAVDSLQRRKESLEQVFRSLFTAAILYDLFGRVIQVNDSMQALIKQGRLPVQEMTALDLLITLGVDPIQGRDMLRYIILARGEIRLAVTVPDQEQHAFLLNLRAVAQVGAAGLEDEAMPFQLRGIVFELFDISRLRQLNRFNLQAVEDIHYQLRNALEALGLAGDLLKGERLAAEQRPRVLDIFRHKITAAAALIGVAHQHLRAELDTRPLERYPVAPKAPLLNALNTLQGKILARRLRLALELPEAVSLALAEPATLSEVLTAVLDLLVQEAAEGGRLHIALEERERWIVFRFATAGSGLSSDRFEAYLSGREAAATQELRRLRQALHQVTAWGGEAQAHSGLGEETRIVLRLCGFI